MKTKAPERIAQNSADRDLLHWTVAPSEYTHFRLEDGRVVPVLTGGMVEMAITTLGGVLREVETNTPRHGEN